MTQGAIDQFALVEGDGKVLYFITRTQTALFALLDDEAAVDGHFRQDRSLALSTVTGTTLLPDARRVPTAIRSNGVRTHFSLI